MLKALGCLMFVVAIWLGLTLYVGEPDPTTSWVLETVGLESWLPTENDPSAGQRARPASGRRLPQGVQARRDIQELRRVPEDGGDPGGRVHDGLAGAREGP